MKWEILSGYLTHKGDDILYHVRCQDCHTVRLMTKEEIEDNCECDYVKEEE